MQVFEIQEKFGLESLKLAERPEPQPGTGEVLIKLRAASLNFRDLLVVTGQYNPRMPLPRIPLSDGVGEVVGVGVGVTRVKVGDRVAGCFMPLWVEGELNDDKGASALGGAVDGMLAEYVVLPAEGVVHVPAHLSDAEAATLPCAGVTAWNALMEGGLQAGETVLVLGTGGVSLFALQFARLAGAKVIATSSSDEKLARARDLGAAEVINYKTTPEWDKRVRELTGGKGVDHVVEVGGAGTLGRSFKAVRTAGHIPLIGVLSGGAGEVNPIPVLMKALRVRGIYVGSRAMFTAMNRAIELHQLHPVIDRVFPWKDAPAALRHMQTAAHFGKIVLQF